ncbi:hypothetical protein CDL15_Pgr028746 [Punica granatum]|uniref:Uncharacterized protein n=1 Tax=Punica granatum TaxID=22663 RepID=A0A218VXT9_PUNGR|nr:hypothetical protein CDL15_Pgr028746 [Punica granatum]PKI44040.1 hypothetical protein CRG98_035570 [Punica granatum]
MIPCCFAFPSKKKGRRTRAGTRTSRDTSTEDMEPGWGQNNGMLTDLSTFSVEEQERRLRKAKEEEERARRNAEIMDQFVRQESKRIVVS